MAEVLGLTPRAVLGRRSRIEKRHPDVKIIFDNIDHRNKHTRARDEALQAEIESIKPRAKIPKGKERALRSPTINPDEVVKIPSEWRFGLKVKNGVFIIGSDAHYKPHYVATAHRAMVALTKALKPRGVILNGDIFDASSVSRHFRIRWERRYSVKEELEACVDRSGEIEAVAGNAWLGRTWGNHDSNFETRLSGLVPEYEGVAGFTLWEHLPRWQPCMSVFINDGPGGLVVKHRFKGGMHAPHNNVLWAGRSMTTGHLHSQKVQPITNYNGTLYGTDSGCLATPDDDAFHYAEDDPRNWRSGFSVHTFIDGEHMPPDLCTVIGSGRVWFRGEVLEV